MHFLVGDNLPTHQKAPNHRGQQKSGIMASLLELAPSCRCGDYAYLPADPKTWVWARFLSNRIAVAAEGRCFVRFGQCCRLTCRWVDGDISSPHRIIACMHHLDGVLWFVWLFVTPHEVGVRKASRQSL
jgi:hypothetical protein